jgi:hypothetical protein
MYMLGMACDWQVIKYEALTMSNKPLPDLAKEINRAFKASVKSCIKVGMLLNEAREQHPDTKSFGKWREDNLSGQIDQKTANRYMNLAKCFSENPPDNIPLSGLYDLSAPKNDDYREGALKFLGDDLASLQDVEEAIEQAKVNQETISTLDDVLSKVNDLSVQDSRKVFMKIVEHTSVAKVQGWLDMASKPQEVAA